MVEKLCMRYSKYLVLFVSRLLWLYDTLIKIKKQVNISMFLKKFLRGKKTSVYAGLRDILIIITNLKNYNFFKF